MGDIEPYFDPYAEYAQWAVQVNPFVILVRFVKLQHNVWHCFWYIMYRKAEKMLADAVKPIQDSFTYMSNTIQEAKQRVFNIPKMIMEAVISFIRDIVDGFKLIVSNIFMYPINICVCAVETAKQTVFYPFRVCFVAISSSATEWFWSFVCCHGGNQEPHWASRYLQGCLQATHPIRSRASTAVETVQEVCHDMPDASVSGGFRVVWWMLVWLVVTSVLGVWRIGIETFAGIKNRIYDKPRARVQQTYNDMHDYMEDLFGSVYVNVVRLHGEAKIFVRSYSQIPSNILALIIRDRIRTLGRFSNVRQWLRDNVSIPVIIEDNVHRTVSRHTLSSDGSNDDIAVRRDGSVSMGARRGR